jgi:hypothetical protein
LTAYAPLRLAGSFNPTALMGFRPSKLSPPDGWPDAFAPPPHLRRYPTDPRPLHAAENRHRQARLPGFDPDERPWPAHPLFTGDGLDAPLGFRALQGNTTAEHARRVSPPSSPHALPRRQAAPAPQGLDAHAAGLTQRPRAGGSRTVTQTTLMGFARRRHPQSSRRTWSGLMGSPHGRPAVTGLPCPVPRTTLAALPQPLAWR